MMNYFPFVFFFINRLRTLVMAKKELSQEEYESYLEYVSTAEKTIENREEVKSACYETIEHALVPIGVSGIEDLLQDNVYSTIDVGIRLYFSSSSLLTFLYYYYFYILLLLRMIIIMNNT